MVLDLALGKRSSPRRAAPATSDDLYREHRRWQTRLAKMLAKPDVEQADIDLTMSQAANATRLYHESLDDSGDSEGSDSG